MQLLGLLGSATLNTGSYLWRQRMVSPTGDTLVPDVGDWIMPHPDGYHLSCVKPAIFDATHEPVSFFRYTTNEVLGGAEL
jgi:hypothetical protein